MVEELKAFSGPTLKDISLYTKISFDAVSEQYYLMLVPVVFGRFI